MQDSHHRGTELIRRMHRRIMLLAASGILLTSLLAGLCAVLPYYHHARIDLEEITRITTRAQADALHHQLTRYQDIVRQFASRSEIRRQLEAFERGDLSLEQLQTFTAPRLAEAMLQAPDVVGLVRQHISGTEISRIGLVPDNPAPGTSHAPGYPCKFIQLDNGSPLVQACAHILDSQGAAIGRDIVFFRGDALLELLRLDPRLSPGSLVWLTDARGQDILSSDQAHLSLGQRSYEEQLASLPGTQLARFDTPLGNGSWMLHVAIPTRQLHRQSLDLLLWPAVAIVLLALLGTLLIHYLIRPVLREIYQQALALEHSEQEQRQAASVFRHASEAILITDPDNCIIEVNPAFCRMTGQAAESLAGRPLAELVARTHLPEDLPEVLEPPATDDSWQGEVHYQRRDGKPLVALQTTSAVRHADGRLIRYIHIFNDITEKKREEDSVRFRALHDELTGLPNRALLEQRLYQYLHRRRQEDSKHFALLFLDLDHFKAVNDNLGHQAGDQLLRAVGERLTLALRSDDLLARLGGDEFIMLLDPVHAREDAASVAANVRDALTRPFHLGQHVAQIGVSIGIAIFPEDGHTAEDLLKAADQAMYAAKQAGRNTWRFALEQSLPGLTDVH